ncbi:tRNA pseudouridine(55) synthase TruB [Selenomonas sp. ND2010]|uniref:tRNA pseudouridine(55) synthase TruB n=1 Tax=Selenomonas sp. ND2010 TaxID=1410618 RepID=UPI000B02EAB7|nr:tRNA pseudouridine(55) synthase TruB [Selenomonas sp. ND2010]
MTERRPEIPVNLEIGGFLNILKPPGMSSHDVIGFVRRVLHVKRVGHAGTLDPAAAGVLPIAVGQSARLIEYLELADKTYRAEVKLGFATDSGDDTGEIIESMTDFAMPTADQIRAVLEKFTGRITQVPPAHSAIKINGRRACDLIREGKSVEIPSRTVTIHRLELLAQRADTILIDTDCSKGTYIRSLCTDIGAALGIPATMAFLVRRRVGDFQLADALTLEEFQEKGASALLDPAQFLSHLERYDLNPLREKAFGNGLSTGVRQHVPTSDTLKVYANDRFIGIGRFDRSNMEVVPVKVFRK